MGDNLSSLLNTLLPKDTLSDRTPRYFVEAGAHDGVGDSTTLILEQRGWNGLCIEPSSAFKGLVKSRKCSLDNRALWSRNEPVTFHEILDGDIELSGIPWCFEDDWDRTISRRWTQHTVEGVTLEQVLIDHKAPKVVDFLSLDTEGSELNILLAHDFNQYRFLLICVEHNGVVWRQDGIKNLLIGNGYKLTGRDEVNDYYTFNSL